MLIIILLMLFFGGIIVYAIIKATLGNKKKEVVELANDIVVMSVNEKSWMKLSNGTLTYYNLNNESTIPLGQIISFELREPTKTRLTGLITVRLSGSSGTSVALTSFLSVGNTNNIEFYYDECYNAKAIEMKQKREQKLSFDKLSALCFLFNRRNESQFTKQGVRL